MMICSPQIQKERMIMTGMLISQFPSNILMVIGGLYVMVMFD